MPSEAEINRALDAYEEGMRFQALAVIIAKQHWPDLVACEHKKDLGADAIANPTFCAEGGGKILARSITASIGKIRSDAKKIKDHFPGITKMIFATSAAVTNEKSKPWVSTIRNELGLDLGVMSGLPWLIQCYSTSCPNGIMRMSSQGKLCR